jgi:phosphoglucomutase
MKICQINNEKIELQKENIFLQKENLRIREENLKIRENLINSKVNNISINNTAIDNSIHNTMNTVIHIKNFYGDLMRDIVDLDFIKKIDNKLNDETNGLDIS